MRIQHTTTSLKKKMENHGTMTSKGTSKIENILRQHQRMIKGC